MSTHDAAYVARQIGVTTNWMKRNAQRLPHSRAGRSYFWTDEDVAAVLEALKVRPADLVQAETQGYPRPLPAKRGRRQL